MYVLRNVTIATLAVIVAWGFFLRVWQLGEASLWIDEGYTIHAARAIGEHGYPLLDSGKIYLHGPLSTYMTAAVMELGSFDPFNPWQARVFPVLFGTALVIVFFLFSREICKSRVLALISAFLISFSAWEIAWSRQARGYAMLSFFVVALVYCLWKYIRSKENRYLALAVCSLLGAALSHSVGLAFIPGTVMLLVYYFCDKQKKTVLSPAAWTGICFITFVILLAVLSPETSDYPWNYVKFFTEYMPLFSIGALIGALLGYFDQEYRERIGFVSVFCFAAIFFIVNYSPTVQFRYLFPVFPFMVILSIYGAYRILTLSFPRLDDRTRKSLLAILLLVLSYPYLTFSPREFYKLEYGSPQPDFKTVFSIVQKERTPGEEIVSAYAPLNEIYLGEKGAWIKIAQSNRKDEAEKRIINGLDYYSAAPVLHTVQDIEDLVSHSHGFIVIDAMTVTRMPELQAFLKTDSLLHRLFRSGNTSSDFIELYKF